MSFDVVTPDPRPRAVFFDRRELDLILKVYGRMVAQGEWRDYAIDSNTEAASFAVFRHASEAPIFRIEKRPALARRQGAWSVISQGGLIVKRARELAQALRVFDKGRFSLVE